MLERVRDSLVSSRGLGGALIFVGLIMFLAVFFVTFPVLSDPVGTYDEWFPESDEPAEVADPIEEEELPDSPMAAFRFVAESTLLEPAEGVDVEEGAAPEEPMVEYRVTFEDRSEATEAELVQWRWDLGDGAEASRPFVEHMYEGPGSYPVRLEVEDSNGQTAEVEGEVEVPDEGRNAGLIEAEDDLDLSGIESAVEDAVGTLEVSVDDALDSIGSAVRNAAIVALFALAAIATTIVAWRITRSGIMLLAPSQQVRLKVKSADMQVDVGKDSLDKAVAAETEQEPELVEV